MSDVIQSFMFDFITKSIPVIASAFLINMTSHRAKLLRSSRSHTPGLINFASV